MVLLCARIREHMYPGVSQPAHLLELVILGAYALAGVALQALLRRGRWADAVRLTWVVVDLAAVTAVLHLLDAVGSSYVMLYAINIVGAGLWFRARLVWLATVLAGAGYGILLADAHLRGRVLGPPNSPFTVLIVLGALGLLVSYQVERVRALSRYSGVG
jgi:hypothetical protein